MSLLVTPRHLSQRAELYQQLSQLTAAGIPLPQAVDLQLRAPPGRSFRGPLRLLSAQLAEGSTLHDALSVTGDFLSPFENALLDAGEKSGRLPGSFSLLAEHFSSAADLLRKAISGLLYPALLFHMAVLIAPLPELFRTWNAAAYLLKIAGVLLPVYGMGLFLAYSLRSRNGPTWRGWMERVLHRVPVLGSARRHLALARLSSALEALISAGVPIIEAWELAAPASGSPFLEQVIHSWKPRVLAGVTPAEALRQSGGFPDVFVNLYHTGEVTGSLDDTLRRLHVLHQAEGSRQTRAIAEWAPRLVYFGIAIMVAWQVIRFWTGYFEQIGRVVDF